MRPFSDNLGTILGNIGATLVHVGAILGSLDFYQGNPPEQIIFAVGSKTNEKNIKHYYRNILVTFPEYSGNIWFSRWGTCLGYLRTVYERVLPQPRSRTKERGRDDGP